MAAKKTRVFSGVQPTGNLHLGNYLGAITKFVALQAEHECIYCVVDLHAITVCQDPDELTPEHPRGDRRLRRRRHRSQAHIIFNQSQVSGHAELAWMFNCVARIGWLEPHDAVQGQGGQGSRERHRRALRLSQC